MPIQAVLDILGILDSAHPYISSIPFDVSSPQVFVANPNKPPEIEAILRRNKDRLLVFLREFHADREGEPSCIIVIACSKTLGGVMEAWSVLIGLLWNWMLCDGMGWGEQTSNLT